MNKEYRLDQLRDVLNTIRTNCVFEAYNADLSIASAEEIIEIIETISFDSICEYRDE